MAKKETEKKVEAETTSESQKSDKTVSGIHEGKKPKFGR